MSTSACGLSTGVCCWGRLEGLGLPLWGPGVEVVQLLELRGFWQHQVLRGVGSYGRRKYSVPEGYSKQYWPIHSSILAWRTPPWQRTLAGYNLQGREETQVKWPCVHWHKTFACGCSAPVRAEHEGGTDAWLVGTLVAPRVRGHRPPALQELWPYQSLFLSLLQLVFRMPLWPVFLCSSTFSVLRGLPCLGSFSIVQHIRHIDGPPWLGSYSVDWRIRHLKGHPWWGPTL